MTPLLSRFVHRVAVCTGVLVLCGCAAWSPPLDYTWVVHSPDRADADRALDLRRKPEKLLEFYRVRPGMRVLDVSAGRGYNTELLARAVGSSGRVYAQNSPSMIPPASKAAMEERMKNR